MAAFWLQLSRLGEAQLLLPAMALAVVWLFTRPGQARVALGWLLAVLLAAALTTASKVAFIGYGWGLPALDFTGFSGHAMFAAAVLPPLLRLSLGGRWPGAALAGGYLLAAAVAVSRVAVGAHSWSEVVSGYTLGALASGAALAAGRWPRQALTPVVPLALAAAMVWGVAKAPPSRTHDWVTRLALASSGRLQPYQRWVHRARPAAGSLGASAGGVAAPGGAAPSLQAR